MLPAQSAILHPIPTGPWKGWWETLCSISLALYHQLLHCCPGIVSSLISLLVCKGTLCIWLGEQEHFPLLIFCFACQPTQFLSAADHLKSGCLTCSVLLTTGTYHSSWPRPQEWDNCRLLIKPPGHAEVCYPVRFSVMLPDSSSHKMHSSQILIVCFEPACLFVDVGGLLCRCIPIAVPRQERWKTVCNHKVDHWLKMQIYYTA